jgi:hypothetical protein
MNLPMGQKTCLTIFRLSGQHAAVNNGNSRTAALAKRQGRSILNLNREHFTMKYRRVLGLIARLLLSGTAVPAFGQTLNNIYLNGSSELPAWEA